MEDNVSPALLERLRKARFYRIAMFTISEAPSMFNNVSKSTQVETDRTPTPRKSRKTQFDVTLEHRLVRPTKR